MIYQLFIIQLKLIIKMSNNPNSNPRIERKYQLVKSADALIAKINRNMTPILLDSDSSIPIDFNNLLPINQISESGRRGSQINYPQKQITQNIDVLVLKYYDEAINSKNELAFLNEKQSNFLIKANEIVEKYSRNLYEQRQLIFDGRNLTANNLPQISSENYIHIIVQRITAWIELKNQVKKQIEQIKKALQNQEQKISFILKFFQGNKQLSQNQIQLNKVLQNKIRQLIQTSFFLGQNWHYQNNTFRIICIHKLKNIQKGHFYIYTREYETSTTIRLSSQPLEQSSAFSLKQKLSAAYFSSLHKNSLDIVANAYMQRTQNNLSNALIFSHPDVQLVEDKPIIRLQTQPLLGKQYSNDALLDFIMSWKNKANYYENNSKTYIYIQPTHIYIPKTDLAKSVTLITDNAIRQSFYFAGQNNSYFVFEPNKKQTYSYDIQKFPSHQINFNAQIIDNSNRRNNCRNKIRITNIQNEKLGYSYQLSLVPQNYKPLTEYQDSYPYILLFQAVIRKGSAIQKPENLSLYRSANLLTKLGKIPNLYSSYYEFDYTPQIHPFVSQIVNGTATQLNKKSFQETYLKFVNFFQSQQNKSQNYCQYLKINGAKPNQSSGFVMRDRYIMYSQYLKASIQEVKVKGAQIWRRNDVQINKDLAKRQLANLNDDMSVCELQNAARIYSMLQKFIIYQHYVGKGSQPVRRVGYNISMIKIADRLIQIYNRSTNSQAYGKSNSIVPNNNDLSIFFIAFINGLYPYCQDLNILRQQLTHMRIIVQKYIPQFNYLLNRKGVGLQNYISTYLLQLFTSLPMQLCYRIWDHMVINVQRVSTARLISIYTIMLFQQKSNMLPFYPINQLITAIHINSNKVKFDNTAFFDITKSIQNYTQPSKQRQQAIVQLAKQKYLRRFAFSKNGKQTNILDEDRFEHTNVQQSLNISQANFNSMQNYSNNLGLKNLSYPLPTPGYGGYNTQKVYLFIGGVFFLGNLNVNSKTYRLQINLAGGSEIKDQIISQKSSFINKFIEFDYLSPAYGTNINQQRVGLTVEFRLIQSPNLQLMNARLKLDGFHKNVAYRENINLQRSRKAQDREFSNMVSSIINLTLIIRSQGYQQVGHQSSEELNKKQIQFYEKILDFDLTPSSSEVVKAAIKLDNLMYKIMDPLDQLDEQKYRNLKMSTSFKGREPQWIRNSKVSIQELKLIFGHIFTQESQRNIKLNFPKFYQSYAMNYQKFQLGEFLIDLILMAPISKLKKLSMIFCITAHYQNIYQGGNTQRMSVETLNSVISYIIKSTGYINACPFVNNYFGKILYGCYYEKGDKVQENKNQITQTLQDWLYICQLNSNYSGIIIGTVNNLSVLKAMLPSNILTKIQRQPLCRFQIYYQVNSQVYIWAATVNTSDFSVAKRGVKFLNNYPKYSQNQQYLTPVAQIMQNCSDLIPLQSHALVDYQTFIQIFRTNPLLQYLLSQNQYLTQHINTNDKNQFTTYQLNKQLNISKLNFSINRNQAQKDKQTQIYTDFAIERHQNCVPKWKKCKVVKDDGKIQVLVQFKGRSGYYLVPRYQVICMDEVNSEFNDIQVSQSSITTSYDHSRF